MRMPRHRPSHASRALTSRSPPDRVKCVRPPCWQRRPVLRFFASAQATRDEDSCYARGCTGRRTHASEIGKPGSLPHARNSLGRAFVSLGPGNSTFSLPNNAISGRFYLSPFALPRYTSFDAFPPLTSTPPFFLYTRSTLDTARSPRSAPSQFLHDAPPHPRAPTPLWPFSRGVQAFTVHPPFDLLDTSSRTSVEDPLFRILREKLLREGN